jgi:hypothetical protein
MAVAVHRFMNCRLFAETALGEDDERMVLP